MAAMSQRLDTLSEEELELDWGNRARPDAMPTTPPDAGVEMDGKPGKGMPGDPQHMSLELRLALAGLLEGPGLRVQQEKSWAEILVGWETRNRYMASDAHGRPVVCIGETGDGWKSDLLRNFWPFHPIRLECMTLGGTLALTVERPWSLLFAHAEVTAWDGRPLGRIQQRWRFAGRCLSILSPAGVELATVEGPWFKPWTFQVKQKGVEVAVIRKKWGGLTKEVFTQADDFGVEFMPGCTDPRLRQLILAATLLVDITWFEKRGERGRGDVTDLLPSVLD
jgi:hypothetical protein